MDLQKLLRMKGGVGEDSYANNSTFQRNITSFTKPVVEESIKQVYDALNPKCFMMADMGCSSGPNALLVATEAINVIHRASQSLNRQAPEFGVFLNDLSGNDFNTLFTFLPEFYKWVEQEKGADFGPCFVSGTPGSFHGRVFPNSFLHFVYSGSALHWLSQVPEELMSDQGVALNKGKISLDKTSPPEVHKAYYTQFKKDFTLFLRSRAMEVVPSGSMVLTLACSIKSTNPSNDCAELLASTLQDMILQGMIEEEKLDKFNMPVYFATPEEVGELVEEEGSFVQNKLETFTVDWFSDTTQDLDDRARLLVRIMRSTSESLLAKAFGEAIIHDLFSRFEKRVHQHIATGQIIQPLYCLSISMTKKT